jgi:hypothetical protein
MHLPILLGCPPRFTVSDWIVNPSAPGPHWRDTTHRHAHVFAILGSTAAFGAGYGIRVPVTNTALSNRGKRHPWRQQHTGNGSARLQIHPSLPVYDQSLVPSLNVITHVTTFVTSRLPLIPAYTFVPSSCLGRPFNILATIYTLEIASLSLTCQEHLISLSTISSRISKARCVSLLSPSLLSSRPSWPPWC